MDKSSKFPDSQDMSHFVVSDYQKVAHLSRRSFHRSLSQLQDYPMPIIEEEHADKEPTSPKNFVEKISLMFRSSSGTAFFR
jgi:hypothetical protein